VGGSPEWTRRTYLGPPVAVHSRPGLWPNFLVARAGAKPQVTLRNSPLGWGLR
jgi:hypothetical protein